MILSSIWPPIWLTFKLASATTLVLLLISIPLSWALARRSFRGKSLVEAAIALPIVLPPTVIGFYLLLCFAPDGPLGSLSEALGGPRLAFSFTGLVLGSVIYSLPFVAQPLQNAFSAIQQDQLDAAATLGAKPFDRFLSIVLGQSKRGLLTAATLGFAHTIGEFGVVLMIGGSIPGETRTASIAIYESVESLNYGDAHFMSAVLLLISFALLALVYSLGSPLKILQK